MGTTGHANVNNIGRDMNVENYNDRGAASFCYSFEINSYSTF